MAHLKSLFDNRAKLIIAIVLLAIVLALAIPSIKGNQFVMNMIVMIFIYATLASAWNIIGGYAGQLSLGHASFFGIGAYSVVLLNINYGISPWLGMIVGIVLAIIAAIIIGWPCFRLRGPFFCLATIAVGEVLRVLAINLTDLTFGAVGVSVPMTKYGFSNMLFSGKWVYMIITAIILALVLYVTYKLERSRLGYYLVAIREDQDAAASLGVNERSSKIISFAISAIFTAVSGSIYAQFILYIDPASVFASNISLQMVVMSVIGGLGTLWGPMLGALLMVPMNELIRAYFGGTMHGLNLLIYSVLLIIVILIIPRGIYPTLVDWVKKYEKTKKDSVKAGEQTNG
jgi:branched-chain amino acid transport system permease protein